MTNSPPTFRPPATPVEMMLAGMSEMVAASFAPLWIHPAVVDTSAIVADLRYRLKHDRPTSLIQAAQFGGLRLYAAHHVYAEILRNLDEVDWGRDIDVGEVERLFWAEYQPAIRYVEILPEDLPNPDELHVLAHRDPSDVNIAILATLLAPTLSFASDRDLCDDGWSTTNWVSPAYAASTTVSIDALIYVFSVATRHLVPRMRSWIGSHAGIVPLITIGTATAVTLAWLMNPVAAANTAKRLASGARQATEASVRSASRTLWLRIALTSQLQECRSHPTGAAGWLPAAARVLAVSPRPLSTETLWQITRDQLPPSTTQAELHNRLSRHAIFVPTRSGWQLGRTMLGLMPLDSRRAESIG